MDAFYGEIRAFAFNWTPRGWLACTGQQAPVYQYQALFALISTTYGPQGNNNQTFALPNMQGRVPMGTGAVTQPGYPLNGGSQVKLNDQPGTMTETLSLAKIPNHNHTFSGAYSSAANLTPQPSNTSYVAFPFTGTSAFTAFSNGAANNTMDQRMIGASGGGQAHSNQQPYLAVNFCICTEGYWPENPNG